MDSVIKLRASLKEIENKIQELKWRCHGRFELMELYQKREELEKQLKGISKLPTDLDLTKLFHEDREDE